jgi:hypothetical protein
MAMGTGAKVAIGCGVAAVLGMIAVVVTLGVGAFWLKGKAEEVAGGSLDAIAARAQELDRWEKKANANPYTPPPDGVVAEDRLLKFLDVRKDVYAVYEEHKTEIEEFAARTKDKKDLSVSETLEGAGRLARLGADVRLAQLKGLADVGMNEEEYRAIQMAVYQSAWASQIEKDTGKMPADAMREQMKDLPEESREAVGQAAEMMGSAAEAMDVPRSNVELFRKHEAEIKKYAMNGLAMLGL